MNIYIRAVTRDDEPFLWQMLYYAAHMHDEPGKTVADAMCDPALALYVREWGRLGDIGFVAADSQSHECVGAAWARLYAAGEKAYSATDDHTPEVAMAVLPQCMGQGIGTQLLKQLVETARAHVPALALNVRADNPALRLYQRHGFVVTNTMTNRVGGLSYDMQLRF